MKGRAVMRARLVILSLVVAAVPLISQSQAPPPVLRAMQDELARAMGGLTLKDQPAPYYASCAVTDARQTRIQASLGAVVSDQSVRIRLMKVDVRVGDYAFDSSRFITPGLAGGLIGSIGMLPVDDDDFVMRRQIWLSADATYKNSVQVFARKRAAFQNRNDTEPIPDFSKETPVEHIEPVLTPTQVPATWTELVRQVSDALKGPDVVSSTAQLTVVDGTRYFVNNEGFRTVAPVRSASLRVGAEVLADDGMSLSDAVAVDVGALDDLPKLPELVARTKQMMERLLATRSGKIGEDYSGPVLVEDAAAAELLAQSLVPLFLSQRGPDAEDPRMTQMSQATMNPFLTRIGNRVLPESFTVKDTPSMTAFNGVRPGGAYVVDDEGMKAQDVTLVQDGRLLTLLTSRTPQKNLPRSNGHGRDGGAQAGVIQIESAAAVPAASLKTRYLEILKTQGRPFGYILRRITVGSGRQGTTVIAAVKVTTQGSEEPVRGLVIGNVTHTTFRDIVAASQERTLLTYRATPSGSAMMGAMPTPGGGTLVSVIAPSLILEELDIQKSKDPLAKKPIVPSPVR